MPELPTTALSGIRWECRFSFAAYLAKPAALEKWLRCSNPASLDSTINARFCRLMLLSESQGDVDSFFGFFSKATNPLCN
jgi:hypothetical protein